MGVLAYRWEAARLPCFVTARGGREAARPLEVLAAVDQAGSAGMSTAGETVMMTDLEVGVRLFSATLRRDTSRLASEK
ncbi:hypothetical protein KYC5002_34595 [Archangium violaceum]|uniref:hypothetical protein n=1 Tax=Archangium violaceum TaxID=83451 RepID=UPI002B312EAF|nr:hypothetical protein KYC5002_34595 [Archangium gephyra]